jgi:small subunit ribosomal protein S17|mmetsp:Transcript_4785/g.637  ORF Transcript_4785/g.637 Transcript_4785/m.637 type:complete len:84 (+) Transcript_4785:81-332(+)
MYGTIVKAGTNAKTVSVKVDRFHYNQKYKKLLSKTKVFRAHDEEDYCVVGDKVVIRLCRPISKTKSYYVRNIVKAMPRDYNDS